MMTPRAPGPAPAHFRVFRPASRRRAGTIVLVVCLFACLPAVTRANVVTSVDLRYDREPDVGTSFWRSSFAVASPASEFGLPPVALRVPGSFVAADPAGTGGAFKRGDQLATQARIGPGRWHGTLAELRGDWRSHFGAERGGVWFSIGAGGVTGGDRGQIAPLIGIGGVVRLRQLHLIAQVDQTPGYAGGRDARTMTFTVWDPEESMAVARTVTDPAVPGELTTITRMQVRAAYERGRIALEAAGGVDAGSGLAARRWMRAGLALAVVSSFSMFASYGGSPAQLFFEEAPGRARGALGIRLTPAPLITAGGSKHGGGSVESWRLQPAGEGRYRLTVRAPGATAVELMGDMTDWQPVSFERAGGSSWEAALSMAPGMHQVLVRVDGGRWIVPPSMTSTESEFAGTVGVLVVE